MHSFALLDPATSTPHWKSLPLAAPGLFGILALSVAPGRRDSPFYESMLAKIPLLKGCVDDFETLRRIIFATTTLLLTK